MKANFYENAPFQGVRETARIAGLGTSCLYNGAKSGRFPHIRSGNRILFNVPALLEILDEESKACTAQEN